MKAKVLRSLLPLALVFTMISCSSDATESSATDTSADLALPYTYNPTELKLVTLINNYRTSIGLNELQPINYVSIKSEEHNEYMIANNVVNHAYFQERSENIIHVLNAEKVGENVAYNYATPEAAFNAWLNSPGHKANIEGDYTSFGISVTENPDNGKKYFTNIFVKQ
ncbi:MAG TPA: CAP domain-containing protein [Flavobacterium sp.]|nr:CAP domain-containing protein [Flavobacterium sp.]